MAVTGLPLALKSPAAPRRAFDNFWARWFTAADGFVGTRVLAALSKPYTNNTTYPPPPPTKNHRLLSFSYTKSKTKTRTGFQG